MSTQLRLPYNRYLELLCLTNVSDSTITDSFEMRATRPPSFAHIQEVRERVSNRMPAQVQAFYLGQVGSIDIGNVPGFVRDFLVSQGYRDVLDNNGGFASAKALFDELDARTIMTSFILSRRTDQDILDAIFKVTKYEPHKDSVLFFKKYFCDMGYMDYRAWKEYIVFLKDESPHEFNLYRSCFDTRFPFELIKWKLNAGVEDSDPDERLKRLMDISYFRTLELMESNMNEEYEMLHSWIEKFIKTYEKHKVLGRGRLGADATTSLQEDAVFELKRVRSTIKNVAELGDNVTKIAAPILLELPNKSEE